MAMYRTCKVSGVVDEDSPPRDAEVRRRSGRRPRPWPLGLGGDAGRRVLGTMCPVTQANLSTSLHTAALCSVSPPLTALDAQTYSATPSRPTLLNLMHVRLIAHLPKHPHAH